MRTVFESEMAEKFRGFTLTKFDRTTITIGGNS
jgi:hypothetical protein